MYLEGVRAALAALTILALAPAARAQSPRPPRVRVEHERGPISVRELRAAWSARRFRRCQEEAHDAIAHLHVRIEPDGSVVIEHGLVNDFVTPELRCVVDVLTSARFGPQTEPTHAGVTIYFRPMGPGTRVSVRWPGSRPPRARPRR